MTYSRAYIHRQAVRLLAAAGISREPVDLRHVVSALNLELVTQAHSPFSSEAALEPMGDGHAIVLSGGGSERRRRFTIAHEIGHCVLHPDLARPERGGEVTEAGRVQEREADAFAAELLMPEDLVRQAVDEHGADVDRLADRFDVSRAAMRARLQRLDILERHGA
jgi:hypothetical protein